MLPVYLHFGPGDETGCIALPGRVAPGVADATDRHYLINILNEQRSLRPKGDNPNSRAFASARLICLVASAKLPSFGCVKDCQDRRRREDRVERCHWNNLN